MEQVLPPIVRRRVKIDFDAANAARWSRDTREWENCLNCLSFFFPAGESYFINSVQNVLDRVEDPELKEQARRFIYQEAMHTKEHSRSNEALKKVHSYGALMEKVSAMMLTPSRTLMPKATQLATSCAIEHFTAMFADTILREQDHVIEANDPAFAALWLWHAVEETEHKAVCFDVYEHIYGRGFVAYLHRVIVMAAVTFLGIVAIGGGFGVIKLKSWWNRILRGGSSDARLANDTPPSLGVIMSFAPVQLYFDYYRRRFHPWDHRNVDLIERWKNAYSDFGDIRDMAPQAAA